MSQFHNVELFEDENDPFDELYGNTKCHDTKSQPKAESKDVIIQIRDQETTSNNFINYIIEINIKCEHHFWLELVNECSWTVMRRFSEFDQLRAILIKQYPACLIPPLPSKISSLNPWSFANQKKDSEFIDCRRQRLEMFLNRLINHAKLKSEMVIFNFLRNDNNWIDSTSKKDLATSLGGFINWRWLNAQSQLIHVFNNSNASYLNEVLKSNSIPDEALKLVDYGNNLQETMKKLINCLTRVDEHTTVLHHLYKNYGEAFFDWCAMDPSMGDVLQSFGHMCDTYSTIIDSPTPIDKTIVLPQPGSAMGGVFTILSWNEISLLLQELYEFGESWIELGGRMTFLLKKLNKHTSQTESKAEQLERLKNGQPIKYGGFSSLTNRFRKSMSESEVSQLQSSLEETLVSDQKYLNSIKASKELFHSCVQEELESFQTIRARDMHIIMYSYASNQLAYSERCLRLWQRARQTLD